MQAAEAQRARAALAAGIRAFFAERGVTEVQTPVITDRGVTDVHLQSTRLADGRYLRTSPEYAHKRLLAEGFGDLFELGAVFRAGEHGRLHREEFTMLEWYRVGWSWQQLADEVVALITTLLGPRPVRRMRWQTLARAALGFDPLQASVELDAAVREAPPDMELPERLDWLFATYMQPCLPEAGLAVISDYPVCQAALARAHPENPALAQRFEVFVDRIELANGYQELTDAAEQRRRFEHDNRRRHRLGLDPMPIDESLLAALARGLPDCAGVALGFDRLAMLQAGWSGVQPESVNN